MEVKTTAKIKIIATPEIIRTIKIYKSCLQFCVNVAWKKKIKNQFKLQPFVYSNIRKNGLPAQFAIGCIKQACGIVKKAKTKPIIKFASIPFNFNRTARFKNNILTLRLLKKTQKFEITIPECYKKYFSWKLCESLLRVDKKGRCFFLFCFSKEVDVCSSSDFQNRVLGIDLGVNNLAATSNGRFYNSSKVKQVKRRFKYLRSKLQAKGTRSAKRLLKKISGREKRFMAWTNHNISKSIVSNFNGNKIVIEDLKGIRKANRGKKMNYWISNWSFYQLQSFITYKAQRFGITVNRIRAHYSSQICHRCGHLGARFKGLFNCFHCGLKSYSADLNAAKNLAHPKWLERQAAVTRPNSRSVEVKDILTNITAMELMAKIPHFY